MASTDTDASHLVSVELSRWETSLKPLWDEWDRQWKRWNMTPPDPNKNPFLSQIQSPWGMHAVELCQSRIVGDDVQMKYRPITDKSDDVVAVVAGKVATWQLDKANFNYVSRDIVRQGLVCGYSVGKVGWRRAVREEDGHILQQHPVDPEHDYGYLTVQVPTKNTVILKDQPFVDYVNLKDFVWPLTATSLDNASAVWQRSWPTLEYLQEMENEGYYTNVDEVTNMDSARWLEAYQAQFADQGLTPNAIDDYDLNMGARNRVEVWERWEDDRLTVIANRRVLLRDGTNPFQHKKKPFIDFAPIPRPSQLHGLGFMRTTEDLNEGLNTALRQFSDAVTYTIAPMFKHTMGVDWEGIQIGPGMRLPVPDTEDVQPLIMPQVDWTGFGELRQFFIEEMQRATGSFEFGGGAGQVQGSRTATGMNIIVSEGARRITEMQNVFNYRTMRRLGELMLSMNEQFLSQDIVVDFSDDPTAAAAWLKLKEQMKPKPSLVGKLMDLFTRNNPQPTAQGLVTVTPDMIRANGDLEPIPDVGTDRQTREAQQRQDAVQWVQALAPILGNPQNPINMTELTRLLSQKFDISSEEIQKLLTPDPKQEAQRNAEIQGAGGAPSGPGGGDNQSQGGVAGQPGVGAGPPGMAQ